MLSSYILYQVLQEAGLPPGVINFVPSDGPVFGEAITKSPDLAGINFTGSVPTFRWLWKNVGQNLEIFKTFPRLSGIQSKIHTFWVLWYFFITFFSPISVESSEIAHIATRWVIPCRLLAYFTLLFASFLGVFLLNNSSHNAIRLSRAKRGVQWHDPKTAKWSNMTIAQCKNADILKR